MPIHKSGSVSLLIVAVNSHLQLYLTKLCKTSLFWGFLKELLLRQVMSVLGLISVAVKCYFFSFYISSTDTSTAKRFLRYFLYFVQVVLSILYFEI